MRLARLSFPTLSVALAGLFAIASPVCAKLPAPTPEAQAKLDETAAKAAWSDKVGLYKVCQAMDRTAAAYHQRAQAAGKAVSAPDPTPSCADPGSYVAAPPKPGAKPLEASEAHSQAEMATSPPSSKATAGEISGGPKK